MEKRYQVFVSSTYTDLKQERQSIIQTLMEMDCIPAGMELFPAADEDQFEFIKKVIDDCDYYLLLIGGRYGSLTEEGISYTEMEFDYAVSKGIRIVALVHGSPDRISIEKSEMNEELRVKLTEFRTKVCSGRMVKFWDSPKEVAGLVALSMTKTFKMYPAVGWVRGNLASQREATEEILGLTKKVRDLEKKLETAEGKYVIERDKLADGDSSVIVDTTFCKVIKVMRGKHYVDQDMDDEISTVVTTWNEIFRAIAPSLDPFATEAAVKNRINSLLKNVGLSKIIKLNHPHKLKFKGVTPAGFDLIKIQFVMLGFVTVERLANEKGKLQSPSWKLTDLGRSEMVSLIALLKNN